MEQLDIIDIGVNLAHRSFHSDRKEVIARAIAAGVRTMIITGTSLVSSDAAVRIAREQMNPRFGTGFCAFEIKCQPPVMSHVRAPTVHGDLKALSTRAKAISAVATYRYAGYD